MNKITLSNGVEMPRMGLGTFPIYGDDLTRVLSDAYQVGYRLIDTADNYYNEPDLGIALENLYASSDTKREDLFLVTKVSDELYRTTDIGGARNKGKYFWKNSPLMQEEHAVKKVVAQKINDSLRALKTDYLDALLMHWPYPDFFEEIWYEMENAYKEGKVRAIGVCNCRERHIKKLKKNGSILPMINQVESSPLNTKEELIDYCHAEGVQVMIYSPLMSLKVSESHPYRQYLKKLAAKYNRNEAQIVLNFDIERGLIPIPKSLHKKRLESNISIFDFRLEQEEMQTLMGFNEDRQYLAESKYCPGL